MDGEASSQLLSGASQNSIGKNFNEMRFNDMHCHLSPALTLMHTAQICPSFHSETRRLVYCVLRRHLVCAESCAMTDADLFLLELVQPFAAPATMMNSASMSESDNGVFRK